MTKAEFIAAISEKLGFTKAQSETVCDTVFDTIADVLVKQDKILIPGFGGFSTKIRAERKGRNPSTQKEMIIPKAVVVSFKPATQLKEKVNK